MSHYILHYTTLFTSYYTHYHTNNAIYTIYFTFYRVLLPWHDRGQVTLHSPLSSLLLCAVYIVQNKVYILIASRTSILGFNSTNIRCPTPV